VAAKENGKESGDITKGGLHAPKPKKAAPDIKIKIKKGYSPVRKDRESDAAKRLTGKRI
jgi:hypothetical protein